MMVGVSVWEAEKHQNLEYHSALQRAVTSLRLRLLHSEEAFPSFALFRIALVVQP